MLFKKDWLGFIPPNIRPNEIIIQQLDRLRVEKKIPPEEFGVSVMMARSTMQKAQRIKLDNIRVIRRDKEDES